MIVTSAITDLRLVANPGKTAALDALADEYMFVTEAFCRHLIGVVLHRQAWGVPPRGRVGLQPKQKTLPPIATPLSERWKRVAWMQACGVVKSWVANGRHKDGSQEPSFVEVTIQANRNVVRLAGAVGTVRDYWLKVSTLAKGQPVLVGFDLHPFGARQLRTALASGGTLSTGVTLRRRTARGGSPVWSAQLCVETVVAARKTEGTRGVDIGQAAILTDSDGANHGSLTAGLTKRLDAVTAKTARKQSLNACLIRKGLPTVALEDGKTERWVRNAIGEAVNTYVAGLAALPDTRGQRPPSTILEDIVAGEMRMKWRRSNRRLKAGQMGYLGRRLRRSLDAAGLPWRAVQPAYTSQHCPHCGFTHERNRPSQAVFRCLVCGFTGPADVVGARNIRERDGDDALNGVATHRAVLPVLARRFLTRWHETLPAAPVSVALLRRLTEDGRVFPAAPSSPWLAPHDLTIDLPTGLSAVLREAAGLLLGFAPREAMENPPCGSSTPSQAGASPEPVGIRPQRRRSVSRATASPRPGGVVRIRAATHRGEPLPVGDPFPHRNGGSPTAVPDAPARHGEPQRVDICP